MIKTPGAISQALMKESPAQQDLRDYTFPLRGIIVSVAFKDTPGNSTNQTLVNVSLLDGYPLITNVPLAYPYISKENGDEETPEIGAMALVQFVGGSFRRPVVTGFLSPPTSETLALTADAPRSKRTRNGTSETIGKDGSRTLFIAKDDNVTITGDGTITVAGDLTINVTQGDLQINVEAGDVTLTSGGTTVIQGVGGVQIVGSEEGDTAGVVTGDCTCMWTGQPHPVVSTTVLASS